MSFSNKIIIGIIATIGVLYFAFLVIFTMGIFQEKTETIKCHNIDTNFNNGKTKVNIGGTNYVKLLNDSLVDKSVSGISFDETNLGFSKFSMGFFWALFIPFFIYNAKKIFKNKISIGIFSSLFLFYFPYFVIITHRIFQIETLKVTCSTVNLNKKETLDGVGLVQHINDEDVNKTKTLNITPFKTNELGFIKAFTIILWIIIVPLIIILIKM
jgi:hypothetical protein